MNDEWLQDIAFYISQENKRRTAGIAQGTSSVTIDKNVRIIDSSSLFASFITPAKNFLTVSGGTNDLFLKSNGNNAMQVGDTGTQIFDSSGTGAVTISQEFGSGDEMSVGNRDDRLTLFHGSGNEVRVLDSGGSAGNFTAGGTKAFLVQDTANNREIKHACVESNLGTQCVYRYRVTTSKKEATVDLPDYFEWLVKGEPTVICQPVKHFGSAYADIYWSGNDPPVPGEPGARLHVKASKDGDYDLVVFATRDRPFEDVIQKDEVKMEE